MACSEYAGSLTQRGVAPPSPFAFSSFRVFVIPVLCGPDSVSGNDLAGLRVDRVTLLALGGPASADTWPLISQTTLSR